MSIYSQSQKYNNVLENVAGNTISTVGILATDFKDVEFTLLFDASADMDIQVIGSDQELPPDLTQPLSPTNMYQDLGYMDATTQAIYNGSTPYNPGAPGSTLSKKFHVQSEGSRWIFLRVFNYSAGTLLRADVDNFQQN